MRKLVAAAICLTVIVTERDHQKKMYKASENADRKKVLGTAAEEGR